MKTKKLLTILFSILFSTSQMTAQSLVQVQNFGTNPGNLEMFVYLSDTTLAERPMVVVLHGCTQTAAECANNTGWNKLADLYNFHVVYPQQKLANNFNYCFNWFNPEDQGRNSGEAQSINEMVEYSKYHWSINPQQVYVTGLSAGAAMVSVMLACYPDVFSTGAVMAGTPYKSATNVTEASSAMYGLVDKTPAAWKQLVKDAYPQYSGNYPKVVIFHGLNDFVVYPMNRLEVVQQWSAVHNGDDISDETDNQFNENSEVEQSIFLDNQGDTAVICYSISNMGHAISIDPGNCPFHGGTVATYSIDKNFHSTWWAARFFGIVNVPEIVGPIQVSSFQSGVTFTLSSFLNATCFWEIPADASISSGQNSNSISVQWGSTDGFVSVQTTDSNGCTYPKEKIFVSVSTGEEGFPKKKKGTIQASVVDQMLFFTGLEEEIEDAKINVSDLLGRPVYKIQALSLHSNTGFAISLHAGILIVELKDKLDISIYKGLILCR